MRRPPPTSRPRRRMLRSLEATAAVLGLLLACGSEATPPGDSSERPAVTVAPVVRTRLPDERERVGQVRAVEDVELRARVTGFLEERRFEEGAFVERGQILFVLEKSSYEAEVRRSEAQVARARAALQKATLDLARVRSLHAQNVASQAALDDAITAETKARADVLATEAELREAQLHLEYTEIRAPISGRIGRSGFSRGDLVGPESGALATLVSIDPIHVYWQTPERVVVDFMRSNMAKGKDNLSLYGVTARLRFANGRMYEHPGELDFIDNRIDPTTGTQTVRAVFPNPEGLLVPGQYASVLVEVGEPHEALVIPQSAVQEDQAGRFALVVNADNVVELRRISTGARQGIFWEVLDGLAEGERVIHEGLQKVRPGQAVDVTEQAPEPPVAPGLRMGR